MHFEIRKNLLKFDDVMDSQRDTIYTLRDTVLASATDMSVFSEHEETPELPEKRNVREEVGLAALAEKEGKAPATLQTTIWQMIERVVGNAIDDNLPERGGNTLENPDRFEQWLTSKFPVEPVWKTPLTQMDANDVEEQTLAVLREVYEQREVEFGAEGMRLLERLLLLDRIDDHWKDHLHNIDYIEEGIRFGAGYGGKDPIVVFKNEALAVFESMYQQIEEEVSEFIFKSRINTEAPAGHQPNAQPDHKDNRRGVPEQTVPLRAAMQRHWLRNKRWAPCRKSAETRLVPAAAVKSTNAATEGRCQFSERFFSKNLSVFS